MTTPTLPEQLRAVVDQVDVPAFAEVRTYSALPDARAPRTRMVVAFAAVLVIVVAVAGAFTLLRGEGSDGSSTSSELLELPAECLATAADARGCEMDTASASRYLGFTVAQPSGIPAGWLQVHAALGEYSDPYDAESDQERLTGVPVYGRVWVPPGTDFDAPAACTPFVTIRERRIVAGENPAIGGKAAELGNGTTAYLSQPDPNCGDDPDNYYGSVMWLSKTHSIAVIAGGIPRDQLLAIARSVDR